MEQLNGETVKGFRLLIYTHATDTLFKMRVMRISLMTLCLSLPFRFSIIVSIHV